jgi:diguanylate cyclase (GGDEF)-like protein
MERIMDEAQQIERLQVTIEIAAQAKELLEATEERGFFARAVLSLVSRHLSYQYALLRLNGPTGTSYTVHARGPWPASTTSELRASLQIPEAPAPRIDVLRDDSSNISPVVLSGQISMPLLISAHSLGELSVFCENPTTERSALVLEVLAREIAFVTRVVFLLEEARRITRLDPITGLLNRRAFFEKLEEEFERVSRYEGPMSLLICDIVQLQRRSERVGFMARDRLVRYVARLAEQGLRKIDFLGRWSGNELALVLPNTPLSGAQIVAERILSSLVGAWTLEPPTPIISVGMAQFDADRTVDTFVARVERALLRAKRTGKSRVEVEPVG